MKLVTGLTPIAILAKARIFLDGVEQHKCLDVDDKAGYIRKYVTTKRGAIVWFRGKARIIELRGVVEIRGLNDEKETAKVHSEPELRGDSAGQGTLAASVDPSDSTGVL